MVDWQRLLANPYFQYFFVFAFTVFGLVFVWANVSVVGKFLFRPVLPNEAKLTTYECGEPTIGTGWVQFDIRFYTVALVFIIFDVEIVFLFPWAAVFAKLSGAAFVKMLIFVVVLIVGFVNAWKKGDLDWVTSMAAHDVAERDRASGEDRKAA